MSGDVTPPQPDDQPQQPGAEPAVSGPGYEAPGSEAPGSDGFGYGGPGAGGPASGAAGSGAPGYEAPGYSAPGYAAPGYAAPGYAAPGYPGSPAYAYPPAYEDPNAKSKLAAGLLGIFLGSFGIHRFYLGYTNIGLTMLLITVLTCGLGSVVTGIWGLVEGILYLSAAPGTKWSVDATGRPLRA